MSNQTPIKAACTVSFSNIAAPSEKYKSLKAAMIATIDEIDSETEWQPVEPKWWLEMMDFQRELLKTNQE